MYFDFGPLMVSLEVRHLLDDYWQLWTQYAGVNKWGRVEVEEGPEMAYAIVRITGLPAL